jgi:hypothetical protein
MATRYAGDYFGITLDGTEDADSRLVELFPTLSSAAFDKDPKQTNKEPRLLGGYKAAPVFGGFKTFEMRKKDQ